MKWMNEEYYSIPLVIAILVVSYLLSRFFKLLIGRYINKHASKLATEVTNYNFLKNAIGFFTLLIAMIVMFFLVPALKNLGITLLASAGILAAFVGFASQHALANIVSGIFIVIFKPIRVGDVTEIANNFGRVEDITLRHTVIRNFQNRRVIIPNSVISNETIINSSITDSKICNFWEVNVSYKSDLDKAIQIIRDEADKHPNLLDNRSEADKNDNKPKIVVRVITLGEYFVRIRAYLWSSDNATGWVLKCDLNKSIKERFDREGIEIPYPHRVVIQKDVEA